ncbi:MAG: thioredoxin [Hyphomonadaceae bacterium]|nr:thioredoxin [Hyphomonadaceae bacterium]
MTMIGADAAPNLVKDGTDAGFMADVIEESRTQPVIVDFWAPWCGPCKTLAPALEKTVRAAKGKVKLVKINIDEHPGVAGQLGVRSIPAVFAFDRGRPVDGFMGAVPESQLRLFVEKLAGAGGPSPGDEDLQAALAEAAAALAEGDVGGAAQVYAAVLQADPENVKAIAGLARCYLAAGEPQQAADTLDMAGPDKQKDADIVSVRAAIELASTAPSRGEDAALEARLAANPNDHQARFDLANALAARGDLEGAMNHLLAIIEKDRAWNDDAARTQLLKIFEAAGLGSELSRTGRRRLSTILFS